MIRQIKYSVTCDRRVLERVLRRREERTMLAYFYQREHIERCVLQLCERKKNVLLVVNLESTLACVCTNKDNR